MLGLGFDGKSAHDFQVRLSDSDDMRSSLQLRPGEPFCVNDLSLTLVSEEQHDGYTQLASSGLVPSYDEYSQHVSQLEVGPQALFTPTPTRMRRLHPTVMETPKRSTVGSSPLARMKASKDPSSDTTDDEITIPKEASIQQSNYSARKRRKLSPALDMTVEVKAVGSLGKLESITSQNRDHVETTEAVSSVQAEVDKKTLETTFTREITPKDESQDSLAGKLIKLTGNAVKAPYTSPTHGLVRPSGSQDSLAGEVDNVTENARTLDKALESATSSIDQASIIHSSHETGTSLKTPSNNNSIQASATNSLEPSGSSRSTRSAVREDSNHTNLPDGGIRILFSSGTAIGNSNTFKKFLKERGVKIVQHIKDATCLCVGKGELKKTTKLIMAVLKGVEIIREDWVTESARLKELQALEPSIAKDPPREHAWGIILEEAVERGRQGVKVFQGWNIIITPSAKKDLGKTNFSDFKDIAIAAGATDVRSSLLKPEEDQSTSTIIVGTSGDTSLPALSNRPCYTKDIISLSVLRGNLDIGSDEFLIHSEPKVNKKRKR